LPNPDELSVVQWVGTATLTEELRSQFGGPPSLYFTGQLWSLGYEVQFYLVVGLALLAPPRWLFPILGGVTAVVALSVLGIKLPTWIVGGGITRFSLPEQGFFWNGMWLPFAAGIGVYVRGTQSSSLARHTIDAMTAIAALWAWSVIPSFEEWAMNVPGLLAPAAVFALLLGWLRPLDARIAGARLLAPLRFCGRMCYSLYLIHAPVTAVVAWNLYRLGVDTSAGVLAVTVPTCAATSVAVAYPFYYFVERRFMSPPGIRTAGLTPSAA
jgi:peptidoglycan/LPS O-acetylase OafA/YrhL